VGSWLLPVLRSNATLVRDRTQCCSPKQRFRSVWVSPSVALWHCGTVASATHVTLQHQIESGRFSGFLARFWPRTVAVWQDRSVTVPHLAGTAGLVPQGPRALEVLRQAERAHPPRGASLPPGRPSKDARQASAKQEWTNPPANFCDRAVTLLLHRLPEPGQLNWLNMHKP
jgi:hypothetical protein